MHVYLRDEPVRLFMREVDAEGLVSDEAGLIPMAFFAETNDTPSFRALLPPQTVSVLRSALQQPVQLGLLADEPEEDVTEVHAMVGISLLVDELPEEMRAESEDDEDDEEELEPWQSSAGNGEAWRGEADDDDDDDEPHTVMLAFAPLVRLARRHPDDFAEELADLLESALAGATKPALEARVDQILGGL
jgi:hypothetical protein